MSKKRKYCVENTNEPKPGTLDLRSLKKGILMSVTVNSRSVTAYREMVEILTSDLFNQDNYFNSDVNNGFKLDCKISESTEECNINNNTDGLSFKSSKELSIAEQIELESRIILKKSSRFELINNISRCLSLIKFNCKDDIPSLMVEKVLKKAYDSHVKTSNSESGSDANKSLYKEKYVNLEEGDFNHNGKAKENGDDFSHGDCILLSSRFVSRLIPLDVICSAKMEDIKKNAIDFVKLHFEHAYCLGDSLQGLDNDIAVNSSSLSVVSWACFCSSRYSGTEIKKQEIYDLFTELIWGPEDNLNYLSRKRIYPVNLNEPDKAVIVEIIRHICGMSILNNYCKYFKYNLNKLLNQ
ncbi:hypothetical protein FG379_002104 [Cryptosporidium bovis]|uniref:uncharacterized protein n=1 Tax=Cryptosporidium bovis TaxID=310047 RepID=UPI00351A66D4|nr:hypothetical protein FG379_002104 [Cryptosporidium bovis]